MQREGRAWKKEEEEESTWRSTVRKPWLYASRGSMCMACRTWLLIIVEVYRAVLKNLLAHLRDPEGEG